MGMFEELKSLGVNVDDGMKRFMGNASLYEKMLKTFPNMAKSAEITLDFDCNAYAEIIEKAHAIKGATGNLSIAPLYRAYTEIVQLLREDKPERAKEVLKEVLPIQMDIIQCIEKYI